MTVSEPVALEIVGALSGLIRTAAERQLAEV